MRVFFLHNEVGTDISSLNCMYPQSFIDVGEGGKRGGQERRAFTPLCQNLTPPQDASSGLRVLANIVVIQETHDYNKIIVGTNRAHLNHTSGFPLVLANCVMIHNNLMIVQNW